MIEIEKRYNYIDALLFLPGLEIELSNFDIWLEDAWNIIMHKGIVKNRILEEDESLSDKDGGDILIWIISFYNVYSDFHNIILAESNIDKDYLMPFDYLGDWPYYLSDYLEQKICKRVNEYILNKKVSCELELYDLDRKCFSFVCESQYNTSLPYEIFKEEIVSRKKFIKRNLYNYFYNQCKQNNMSISISTNEVLMQFMYCFHWFVNYTPFDDEDFTKITNYKSESSREESIKQYLEELVSNSYTNFIKKTRMPYVPSYNFDFSLNLFRNTKCLLLKSHFLSIFNDKGIHFSEFEEDIFDLDDVINKKICIAYNWLNSWRSLR